MDRTLLAVYIGIMCAAMLVLLVWLIIHVVRQIRDKNKRDPGIVEVEGRYYRLVSVDGELASAVEQTQIANAPRGTEEDETAVTNAEDERLVALDSDAVVLKRGALLTYSEAYATLSQEQKLYADGIIAHAESKYEKSKSAERGRYYTVSIGHWKLIQVYIRRGIVCARVTVPNTDLTAYADSKNQSIKEKPIDIRVETPDKVGMVKDLIDLTCRNIEEDSRRKAEERKARRKQRRMEQRQSQEANEE